MLLTNKFDNAKKIYLKLLIKKPEIASAQNEKYAFPAHVLLPVPSEEGSKGPGGRPCPDQEDLDGRLLGGEGFCGHALDDDVVPVEGDHHHGPDGDAAEETSSHPVHFAHKWTEDPRFGETIGCHCGHHEGHHAEIREGKVHDQHVRRGLEALEDTHSFRIIQDHFVCNNDIK